MIWPGLEGWKGRFGPGADQIHDLAAMGLTNLLLYLREVILQDAAVLCEQFPTHPVWNHPVFRHEAFAPFAQHVRASTRDGERPSQLMALTQAIPTLADYLKLIDARNEARADELKAAIAESGRHHSS